MKVLVGLAFLCLLQAIAGQVITGGHKLEQHNQGVQGNKHETSHVAGNKDQVIHANQPNKNSLQQAAEQNQHDIQNVAQQHGVQQNTGNKDQVIHANHHPNKNNKQQAAAQNQHEIQNVAQQHGIQQNTGNKDAVIHAHHQPNKIIEQQAAAQNQHQNQNVAHQHGAQLVAQQHVTLNNPQNPAAVNSQQSSQNSKVPVKIPPKVQQVVNQVSQHKPNVIGQHVANKQRMIRSVNNRQVWQDLQVNAVEQPGKCEFICSDINLKACGYNGRCYWEFENQCDLNTYNCLNTQKIFDVVDSAKCHEDGGPKCYRGDL